MVASAVSTALESMHITAVLPFLSLTGMIVLYVDGCSWCTRVAWQRQLVSRLDLLCRGRA